MTPKQITLDKWLEEGKRRFGPNLSLWKFVCPRCRHVQTAADFTAIDLDPNGKVYYSCIGRWKEGTGCNWTLGGLFHIHELEVIFTPGDTMPVFRFAQVGEGDDAMSDNPT